MKKIFLVVFIGTLFLIGVYGVPITEFDFYIPPHGMVITEEGLTYATGSEFYDATGETWDTGNDYKFMELHNRVWIGIGDIMALGADLSLDSASGMLRIQLAALEAPP